MKIFIKIILTVFMLNSIAIASEKNVYFKGCEDVMKERSSKNSLFVVGFVQGTQVLGRDVLDKIGKKTVVSLDFEDIKPLCKDLLTYQSKIKENDNITPGYALSILIRGYLIRSNGFTWDEIQDYVEEIQKKIGLKEEKKKY